MPIGDWVLILTLTFHAYYKGGVAIETVPMFPTKQECLAAGNAWIKQNTDSTKVAEALCVHRGEDQ